MSTSGYICIIKEFNQFKLTVKFTSYSETVNFQTTMATYSTILNMSKPVCDSVVYMSLYIINYFVCFTCQTDIVVSRMLDRILVYCIFYPVKPQQTIHDDKAN